MTAPLTAAHRTFAEAIARWKYVISSREELISTEQSWIDHIQATSRSGLNVRSTATNNAGVTFSKQSRIRCAEASRRTAVRRRVLGLTRKPDTEETKQKRRSWWNTEAGMRQREWLRQQNESRRGVAWTEAQRSAFEKTKHVIYEKSSAAHRGKPWSEKRRAAHEKTRAKRTDVEKQNRRLW